jgi:hypothetical protein
MPSRLKWYFITVWLGIFTLLVCHFVFSPVQLEKVANNRKKSDLLSKKIFHQRERVEKILLQNDQNQRVVYRIYSPSSRLNFKPLNNHIHILEEMDHFKIQDENRVFQGNQASYDFKSQTLYASDFNLAIYNGEETIFRGTGQNLSFYFHDLKPCFSTKNFSAALNIEKESL